MTDEERVLACQRGDKAAWEQLYAQYKPEVLRIARRFFLSGGEPEDLVQEGMCGLYSAVMGYRESGGSFAAYAYNCIRNRILDAVKLSGGAKHSALNNFLPIVEIGDEWVNYDTPEDEIIKREDRREFLHKMSKILSSFEFKAMVMYTDGMTLREMSAALDKSAKSVGNAINRAKNKLQKLLED